jgi:ribosome-associated protein
VEAGPLRIPRAELDFHATRAGGPGGQHVNKTASRVELRWNLEASAAPDDQQRARLRERLAHRLDTAGSIRLVEAGSRSQHRNRETVTARFAELIARALRPVKLRRQTRVPAAEKHRRLEAKRRRSAVKQLRGRVGSDD